MRAAAAPVRPPDPPEELRAVHPKPFDTPDPYLRPAEGEIVPQAVWDETSGLDLAQLWHKGERPPAPNCSLLGLRFVDVADTAINSAVTTTLPPGTSFGMLDLKVNFLRPIVPDAREFVARASVEQRGRTIAVTTCRVDDADGKRVAMATGAR
ncbi:MAG: PaaI family thioesterase [Actinomycetota bacterium]